MKNGGKTFNASDVANADWNILPGLTRRRTRAQRARGPIGRGGGWRGAMYRRYSPETTQRIRQISEERRDDALALIGLEVQPPSRSRGGSSETDGARYTEVGTWLSTSLPRDPAAGLGTQLGSFCTGRLGRTATAQCRSVSKGEFEGG